jgi:hypothetical protein
VSFSNALSSIVHVLFDLNIVLIFIYYYSQIFITSKMVVFWVEAPCRLVNSYQSTQCYNPEHSHFHTHCRENLKSHLVIIYFFFM